MSCEFRKNKIQISCKNNLSRKKPLQIPEEFSSKCVNDINERIDKCIKLTRYFFNHIRNLSCNNTYVWYYISYIGVYIGIKKIRIYLSVTVFVTKRCHLILQRLMLIVLPLSLWLLTFDFSGKYHMWFIISTFLVIDFCLTTAHNESVGGGYTT